MIPNSVQLLPGIQLVRAQRRKKRGKKIKKAQREEARERPRANLTKGRSSIPGSGILSDWSIDRFCQHSSITDADEFYNMAAVRDLSMITWCSNLLYKQQAKRFQACENSRPWLPARKMPVWPEVKKGGCFCRLKDSPSEVLSRRTERLHQSINHLYWPTNEIH